MPVIAWKEDLGRGGGGRAELQLMDVAAVPGARGGGTNHVVREVCYYSLGETSSSPPPVTTPWAQPSSK